MECDCFHSIKIHNLEEKQGVDCECSELVSLWNVDFFN
jgi:hypothetical protein